MDAEEIKPLDNPHVPEAMRLSSQIGELVQGKDLNQVIPAMLLTLSFCLLLAKKEPEEIMTEFKYTYEEAAKALGIVRSAN